jgi:hypothetical protein
LRNTARAARIAAWIGAAGMGGADIWTERMARCGKGEISPIYDIRARHECD